MSPISRYTEQIKSGTDSADEIVSWYYTLLKSMCPITMEMTHISTWLSGKIVQ